MNSCNGCRSGKRRCDRVRPSCSTCTRVGRTCIYDDDAPSQTLITHQSNRGGSILPGPQPQGLAAPIPSPLSTFDPFQHNALRQPIVNAAVAAELLKHIGSFDNVRHSATSYFESIYRSLPIISIQRFNARLPSLSPSSPADFTALCFVLHLLQQIPGAGVDSMQSTPYVMVKSVVSLLEGAGYSTLEAVQARVLVAFYEMGHGIYPASSISIGGCARLAIAIGLNRSIDVESLSGDEGERLEAEERRRTWWAIVNLDRYINLSTGNSIFASLDFPPSAPLPIDDKLWSQGVFPAAPSPTLATPSSLIVGVFARECQITHLVGRVIRHVFEPTSDLAFQQEEALLLERTMNAFLPLLLEEGIVFGKYCVALGICCSALFTLHNAHIKDATSDAREDIVAKLDEISTAIVNFTRKLFGDESLVDYPQLSPYIPYCCYQSAVVQGELSREGRGEECKEKVEWLKRVLRIFGRRWYGADRYLKALETEKPDLVFLWDVSLPV